MNEISDAQLDRYYKDPQQDEPPIIYGCSCCCEYIYAGEDCYVMPDGAIYCERCVADAHTIAEED